MRRFLSDHDAERADENRVTQSLASLAFALLLVVVGLYLFQRLSNNARIEDCLLAGRINCDMMLAGSR